MKILAQANSADMIKYHTTPDSLLFDKIPI